jgi:hypothetical protein
LNDYSVNKQKSLLANGNLVDKKNLPGGAALKRLLNIQRHLNEYQPRKIRLISANL